MMVEKGQPVSSEMLESLNSSPAKNVSNPQNGSNRRPVMSAAAA